VIKDRFPVADYVTRKGVSCYQNISADDFIITQAREAGLLFVGISNMTQFGVPRDRNTVYQYVICGPREDDSGIFQFLSNFFTSFLRKKFWTKNFDFSRQFRVPAIYPQLVYFDPNFGFRSKF